MSKVFSAKRQKIEFDYEFLDGTTVSVNAQSLSTKEQSDIAKFLSKDDDDIVENFNKIIKLQLAQNDKSIVKRILKEQYEDGDVVEFSNSIGLLIKEQKEKK